VKLHQIFFGLLILLLPTQLGFHFWPDFAKIMGIRVDYLSPTLYLTDLLVILTIISALKDGFLKKISLKRRPLLLFVGFLLLNCFFAFNQEVAFFRLLKIVEFFLLSMYISVYPESRQSLRKPLVISLAITVAIVLFQFLQQRSIGGLLWFLGERAFDIQTPGIALESLGGSLFLRPYATFSHPNSLAGFLLVGLTLSFSPVLNKKLNPYYLLLIALGLLVSWSYAVWLAGLLLLLMILFDKVRKNKSLYLCAIMFSFIFCAFLLLYRTLPQFQSEVVQERVKLITASLLMIKNHFFIGVGLNNFLVDLPNYWSKLSFRLLQPVHNIYLLIFSETGFVGIIVFLWMMIKTLKTTFETRKNILAVALFVILFLGLFDHYWLTLQQNLLLFSLVLGLCWQKNLPKRVK
jgi:O-antigen ligase